MDHCSFDPEQSSEILSQAKDKDLETVVKLLLELIMNRPECRLHSEFNSAIVRVETKVEEGFKTIFNRLTQLEKVKNGFIEHKGAEKVKDQVAVWAVRFILGGALIITGLVIGHVWPGGK